MTDLDIMIMIDEQPITCTRWEIEFLDSLLKKGEQYTLSPKQRAVLRRMADEYLAESIVAEWLGQLSLMSERKS